MNYFLVAIQFGGILLFGLTGSVVPYKTHLLVLELSAIALGIWAILVMKLHTLSILPTIKKGGQLCTSGPYRILRHPMYTAVLMLLLALLLNSFSIFRLIVFLIVLINLIIKMNVEEKMLVAHYSDYKEYMANTKRIIPFLY